MVLPSTSVLLPLPVFVKVLEYVPPMTISFTTFELDGAAPYPRYVLYEPVVRNVLAPITVFDEPVVIYDNAPVPTAVWYEPDVVFANVVYPKPVLFVPDKFPEKDEYPKIVLYNEPLLILSKLKDDANREDKISDFVTILDVNRVELFNVDVVMLLVINDDTIRDDINIFGTVIVLPTIVDTDPFVVVIVENLDVLPNRVDNNNIDVFNVEIKVVLPIIVE